MQDNSQDKIADQKSADDTEKQVAREAEPGGAVFGLALRTRSGGWRCDHVCLGRA